MAGPTVCTEVMSKRSASVTPPNENGHPCGYNDGGSAIITSLPASEAAYLGCRGAAGDDGHRLTSRCRVIPRPDRLVLVGWLARQWRPKRAPSPVRAPITREKTGKGWSRQAAGSGEWPR